MDEESLRREITAQVRAEFENQLQELKRKKNLLEEEFENASDAWRAERRRLRAEIDQLEDEVSQGKKPVPAPAPAEDTGEAKKVFEEKLRQAKAEREAERERLAVELTRTQAALADAIARSSNPARVTQAVRDQYEVKLAEANRAQLETERQFLRARADWEEDKKRMMGELIGLRRIASSTSDRYGRSDSVEENRIRELEAQLSEARTSVLRSNDTTLRAAQEIVAAKKEVVRLNDAMAEIQSRMDSGGVEQLRHEYEAKIRDLTEQKERLLQELVDPSRTQEAGRDSSAVLSSQATVATDADSVNGEIRRVEAAIRAIERLMDEPDTTASAIARKNAERAELEAYLQGILFQSGRAKGV